MKNTPVMKHTLEHTCHENTPVTKTHIRTHLSWKHTCNEDTHENTPWEETCDIIDSEINVFF